MKYLIATFLVFSCASVKADWEYVGGNDQFNYLFDPGSIRREGEFIAVWEMIDYRNPIDFRQEDKLSSVRLLKLYKCQSYIIGTKSQAAYSDMMGRGKLLFSVSYQVHKIEFTDVIPGSLGESIFERVCRTK